MGGGGRISTHESGTTGLGAEMSSSLVALCNLVSAWLIYIHSVRLRNAETPDLKASL